MTAASGAVSDALERWNAGDLNGYLGLYDERIRLHGYSPEPMTKTEVRAFYEQIFRALRTPSSNSTRRCGSGTPARSASR